MDKIESFILIYPIQTILIIALIAAAIGGVSRHLEKNVNYFLNFRIFRYTFLACTGIGLVMIVVYVW